MYEKTISGETRIYQITIPGTPTLVYDLLQSADKTDYDNLLTTGVKVQPLSYPSLNSDKNVVRVPVDGYILNTSSNFYVSTSQNGAIDTALANLQYTFPVYFWLNKHWVYADSPTQAIIRIFFS